MASRWRIVDHPGERKVHAAPIPRIGGVAMAIGVLIAALLVIPLGAAAIGISWSAAGVLTVFGDLDDRFDLDYADQISRPAASPRRSSCSGGDIQIHAITLDDRVLLPAVDLGSR